MKENPYLKYFYSRYDEDGRLASRHGSVDRMDEEAFRLYFRYHLATCERADMLGFTSHALDIFQKKG